jgi:hypothetical protein
MQWEYLLAYFSGISSGKMDFIEMDGEEYDSSTSQQKVLRERLGLGEGRISRAQLFKWCGLNKWEHVGICTTEFGGVFASFKRSLESQVLSPEEAAKSK